MRMRENNDVGEKSEVRRERLTGFLDDAATLSNLPTLVSGKGA